MKKGLIGILGMTCVLGTLLCGCGGNTAGVVEEKPSTEPTDYVLVVETTTWGYEPIVVGGGELGKTEVSIAPNTDVTNFNNVREGDLLFDKFSTFLKVKSVSEDKVVLSSGGILVEKNSDGTVNLSAKAPDSFTIKSGESLELATQTMDAGATVVITYNN